MESRFTLKDFVFLVLFVVVIGAVVWAVYQSSYQESRLNEVKQQLVQMDANGKQELLVLGEIRNTLQAGVRVNGATGTQASAAGTQPGEGRIRRTNPDGSMYVYYPQPPTDPRNPLTFADYATGDWLVRNLGEEPKVIAPFIEKDLYGQLVHELVLESLVTQNPDTLEFEPQLAESYEQSADGLKLRFTLRKGITFSDGTPVTMEDVLFSYQTIMTDGVDCAPLRSYFGHVTGCKQVGERTVEFTYDEPYFNAVGVVGGLNIIPKHVYAFSKPEDYNKMGSTLVSTGAYIVQKWDRGQQIVLARNDHYWGPRPTFDRIVLRFIQNPQASLQALQNGEIDVDAPEGEQFVKFSVDPDFQKKFSIYKYSRIDSGYNFIGYNEMKPMFKDKETRQALTMLLDRKAIIHSFMRDLATPITGPFNPLSPQNDPTIELWPYDQDRAEKQLQAAGWKAGADGVLERDGKRFEFDMSMGAGNPVVERIANYAKEQFAKAGIRMRITPWEFSVFTERLDSRNFDAAFLSWSGAPEDDPYQVWHSDSIKDKGSNFISFSNAAADKLIEAGKRTLDRDKRMKIWHAWAKIVHEEQPYTFLAAPLSRVFIDNRFKNTEPYRTGLQYLDWYVPSGLQKYH